MPRAGYAVATLRAFLIILALGAVAERARADCDPAAYGVVPGIVNSTGFQNMLQACAGETVSFAAGTYTFVTSPTNPQGFFVWGGTPQSPTLLRGNGDALTHTDPTVFKVTSAGAYPFQALLFIMNNAEVSNAPGQVVNASNITIENIAFEGSSAPAGCPQWDYGNAIWVQSNNIPGATSIENINILRNVISNFSGMNWLALIATDGSPGIGQQSEIAIAANIFDASSANPGSCVNNSANTTPVYQVLISGSSYLPTGLVSNVSVASNNFQSQFVKGAVMITSGTSRISVQYNRPIEGAGTGVLPATGWSTEQGRYAISIYDTARDVGGQGLPPDTIWIEGNLIDSPVSCGVYSARGANLVIEQNSISGQKDTFDGTEPKAAIALNHSSTMPLHPITNNDLQANQVGISVADGDVAIAQNFIDVPANGYGMKISASEGGLFDIRGVILRTAATNAVSVIGAGIPDDLSGLSVIQNGWNTCGGSNPALRWYSDYPGGHAVTGYATIPNIDFGTITANGHPQTAFWLPTCN
jgi:hypothetical protein